MLRMKEGTLPYILQRLGKIINKQAKLKKDTEEHNSNICSCTCKLDIPISSNPLCKIGNTQFTRVPL